MNVDYVKIFITIALAVLGWLIAHWFTSKRDANNKKRELRLQYLINAYSTLACDVAQRALDDKGIAKLEHVLAEIQLFGTTRQIELAKALAIEAASKREFPLDPLINTLRDELRTELNLEPADGNVQWLRASDSWV